MCISCDKSGVYYVNDTPLDYCYDCLESDLNIPDRVYRVLAVESFEDINTDFPGSHTTENYDLFFEEFFMSLISFDMDMINTACVLEIAIDESDIDKDFTFWTNYTYPDEEETTINGGEIVAIYHLLSGKVLWQHATIKPRGFEPSKPDYDTYLTCNCGKCDETVETYETEKYMLDLCPNCLENYAYCETCGYYHEKNIVSNGQCMDHLTCKDCQPIIDPYGTHVKLCSKCYSEQKYNEHKAVIESKQTTFDFAIDK